MRIIGWDKWGYAVYDETYDPQWASISHDWNHHDTWMIQRDDLHRNAAEVWLHDNNRAFWTVSEMDALEDTPFVTKPYEDIRATKTRNHRRHGFSARRVHPQTHRLQPSSYRAPRHRHVFVGPRMPAERG